MARRGFEPLTVAMVARTMDRPVTLAVFGGVSIKHTELTYTPSSQEYRVVVAGKAVYSTGNRRLAVERYNAEAGL